MQAMREARIKGQLHWSLFPGATIAGAAKALAETLRVRNASIEVRDLSNPEQIYELEAVGDMVWKVKGLRGGE